MIEDVLQLLGAVGGINVDQDRAHLGRRKLGQHPLRPVCGPDAHVLTLLDAQGHERQGHLFHAARKLVIAAAVEAMRKDQAITLAEALDGLGKHLGKSQPVDPGMIGHGHGGEESGQRNFLWHTAVLTR